MKHSFQQRFFKIADPEPIQDGTDRKNPSNRNNRMDICIPAAIRAGIIQEIYPQPLAHGVRIGMNHQHAKGGCRHCVNDPVVGNFQVLEQHKGRYCGGYREYLMRIGHKRVMINRTVESVAHPCKDHNTAHSRNHR